ncbi:MAG: hypothetical protein RSD99_09290, partial [Janthinobacterium sp.]
TTELHKLINKSSVPYTTSFSASMSNLSYYFKDDSTVPCPPRAETRRFAQLADDFTFACLTLRDCARRVAAGTNRPLTFFCIEITV